MQAQHPSGSDTEAITNAFTVGEVLKPVGRSFEVKSYPKPDLVESDLNPTQRFVSLADFDTLQCEVDPTALRNLDQRGWPGCHRHAATGPESIVSPYDFEDSTPPTRLHCQKNARMQS